MKHATGRKIIRGGNPVLKRRILLGAAAVVAAVLLAGLWHDFLAVNQPVEADVLVVEGWTWSSPALGEAADEFTRRPYKLIVAVGEPMAHTGPDGDQTASSERVARRLRESGVEGSRIVVLTMPPVTRHHTFSSALALREWMKTAEMSGSGINVFTIGAHARKSLVLFRRALGSDIRLGVVAGTEDSYNPRWWWLSPRGVYVVARKTVGYLYAVLWPFF
jgi:hypothetical protein